MIKADFHIHTGDDPVDPIPYSTTDLIDRAAQLGYGALAITLHERQLDLAALTPYAAERGIVLVPGIERTIEGKHVLLLNFTSASERVDTFADLARLRRDERGLVIAPHAFFPARSCLWGRLERHADLFDAVEYNAMFTASLDFNQRAIAFARAHGKPIVGNGDVHRLRQLGTTYSLVDAPADADAICAAIAAGRVQYVATPLSWRDAAAIMADLLWPTPGGPRDETKRVSDSTNISLPQSA
ncbi:MAG TPA: PHP-associated domain-containing protein [Vicinamibacterales bacterium]|nr:PHP-associated domain-containing protein [Vicinamibacterales bacterium]